jgi:amidase
MQTNDWSVYLDRMLDEIPFTPLFNATGAPAASVPLGKCADGLPVGVQIGAALGREDTLLRLAAALEQTAPWHQRI